MDDKGREGLMDELRMIRLSQRVSQRELAERADVSQSSIAMAEAGKHIPRVQTLEKLADALGVEIGDFFPKGAAPRSESDTEGTHPAKLHTAKRSSTHIMPNPNSDEQYVTLEVDLLRRALKAVEAGIVAADEAEEKLLDLGQHDWVPREEASAEGIS